MKLIAARCFLAAPIYIHTRHFMGLFSESSLLWPREPPFLASWLWHQNSQRRLQLVFGYTKGLPIFQKKFWLSLPWKSKQLTEVFSSVRARGQRVYYCFHFWLNEGNGSGIEKRRWYSWTKKYSWGGIDQVYWLIRCGRRKSNSLITHRALVPESMVMSFI